MKKNVLKKVLPIFLTVLFMLFLMVRFPMKTYAASVTINPGSDTVKVGDSVTVTVTLYGDEIYAYSGNIECDGIFSGFTGGFADGADGGESVSIYYTFQAVEEGTGSISVGGCSISDGVTKQDAGGAACTITVVGENTDNGGGGTGGNAGGNDYNDNYSYDWGTVNGTEVREGSGNTNLGSLEVVGHTLTDEGNGIFSVIVSASVDKITINAAAEDPAATVDGVGEKLLEQGENVFDVIVYAENGLVQGYTVKVTRRGDKIALSDLAMELKETTENQITVSLQDGDKLTKELIDAIAKWGKTLNLNRYDADGKFLYGWTMNGKKLSDLNEFDPTVSFEGEAADQIFKLTNYASGKVLSFAQSGKLPKGTKFTFAAGTDFQIGDQVRLYYYDNAVSKLTQTDRIKVESDTITLELDNGSDYFVTRSNLVSNDDVKVEQKTNNSVYYIIMAVELAIILALTAFIFLKVREPSRPSVKMRKPESHSEEFFDTFDDYETTDIKK